MSEHEESVVRLRRQIGRTLVLRQMFPLLTGWCFLWGAAVLAGRVTVGLSPWHLLWGAAVLPVAAALGAALALRRLPSRSAVRALLDRSSGCGGLLVASEEEPLGAWEEALPPARPPSPRWRSGQATVALLAALAFVAAGLLLPIRSALISPARSLDIDKEARQLREQIDVLKDEEALKPQRAESLKTELQEIEHEATAQSPEEAFEALDHLTDLVKKTGATSAEDAVSRTEQLAKAGTLAEALEKAHDSIDARMTAEALAEMSRLLGEAGAGSELVQKNLPDELTEKVTKPGQADPEQLREIAGAIEASKEDLAGRLQRLYDAKLIDEKYLQRNKEAGKSAGEKLAELMKQQSAAGEEKGQAGEKGEKEKSGEKGSEKGQEGKGQEGKGQEGKGQEGKGQEGKGQEGKGQEGKGQQGQGQAGKGQQGKGQQGQGQTGKGQEGEGQEGQGQEGQAGKGQSGQGQQGQGQEGEGQQGQPGEGQQGQGQEGEGQQGQEGQGKGQQGGGQKGGHQAGGGMSIREMLAQCNRPGSGGLTEGRGDAAMTFGKETTDQGAKFKEITLPPGQVQSLKDSQLVGTELIAPSANKNASPTVPGSVGAAGAGGAAVRQTVLPRHRAAVRRYFEREQEQ